MWISLIIAIATFCGYLACYISRLGIPESLSYTYYGLGKRGWIFSAMMLIVGISTMMPMIDLTPDSYSFVPFLCGTSIAFVGVASEYAQQVVTHVHCVSAIIAAIMAAVWCVLLQRCWYVLLLSGLLMLLLAYVSNTADRGHKTFWLEMWAFSAAFLTLITRLYTSHLSNPL